MQGKDLGQSVANGTVNHLRQCIEQKDWEAAWSTLQQYWPGGGVGEVVALAKELQLEKIDIRFAGWWLDCLIVDRRPRQALVQSIAIIRQQPYISIAQMIFPRIQKSLKALGMNQVRWDQTEGVMILLQRLREEHLTSATSIAILNAG
jgi:hypothetical protein